jgi:hypothetical protein
MLSRRRSLRRASCIATSTSRARVVENLDQLVARVRGSAATVIVDKQSYRKILPSLQDRNLRVIGESENLICFTVS